MDHAASHSCHLLQQLHEQRIQGLLCDCMLVVKIVCLKAHKNVLAAFSQYYRSLFQNASRQKNYVFHLDIKNIGGIGQILDFMYTSHLDLNNDNIQVMVDTAQCLQVQNVLSMCYSFLKLTNPVEPTASIQCSGSFSIPSSCPVHSNPISNEQLSPPLLKDTPLPLEPLPAFSHTFVSHQDPEHSTLQFPEQMQLKKAVHLKKLNILRSQKASEGSSQPETVLQCTTEPLCSGEKVLESSDRGLLEKEAEFTFTADVQRHIVIHTGVKPHLCNICGQGNLTTVVARQ
ncbi:hypothetical protein XELAEV_18008928mg [Xenopus laevis]|uniref:BTB domain-containing protein n=1 Tax=Xenopus laevis TaxID=8355 RepID=A0A974DT55_XENLA|nr:hypothetical protein XELAEV_18008928mg [Xenopus laevis]